MASSSASVSRPVAFAEVALLLNSNLPLNEKLDLVIEKARQVLGAEQAALFLTPFSRPNPPTKYYAFSDEFGSNPQRVEHFYRLDFDRLILLTKQPLRLTANEFFVHTLGREFFLGEEPFNWLSVPISESDCHLIGIIQLSCKVTGEFSEENEAELLQLAAVISLAAEKEHLSRSEQHARQVAETLRVASLALTQQLNLNAVLVSVLDYLSWVVPYDRASLVLVDNDGWATVRAIRNYDPQTGISQETEPFSFNIQDNPTIHTLIKTKNCVVVPDTHIQPVWERRIGGEHRSWLGVPLVSESKSIGMCVVEKAEAGFFTEEHQRLAEALAAQAAVAIDNAALFDALRRSEEHYRAATELASDYAYAFRVDTNGKFVREWVTEAFTRITGYSLTEADVMGGWLGMTHSDDFAIAFQHMQTLLEGNSASSEYRIVTKAGDIRWLRDLGRPVWDDAQERVTQVFGAAQDITDHKQHERELEVVAMLASALRAAITHGEMLPVILDQALKMLNAAGAAIALCDPSTQEIVIELGRGAWEGWVGLRLPISEGLSGQVITTGRPYLNNDAGNDSPRARLEPIGELQAIACVPLIAQDETIGALWVGRSTPIQGNEMHLIHAIADIAANGIHRATLFEQTERRLQHLTALRTIDRAITTSLDLRVTLDILLDHITAQLNVHAADIFLFDPATQTLEFTAGRGFRSIGITRSHLRVGEGYAGRAILERKPLHLSNMMEAGPNKVITPALAGEGFVSYYGLPLITKGQIKGVLEVFHRARFVADPEWLDFLETLAGQAAIAIENAQLFDNLQRSNIKLTLAYDATIEGWSRALELRQKETEGHSQRVTEMTLHLGREMGMNEAELVHVRRGALLHDIGKMGIPDSILLRPGPLSSDEWEIMRMHPKYANDMLMPIDYLRLALDIPYCHHEKWDGTGYPRGLKGKQIPLAARIFMIADVWDAVNSDRPYGQAWHRGKALAYIKEQSGIYFDPQVVEMFLKLYQE